MTPPGSPIGATTAQDLRSIRITEPQPHQAAHPKVKIMSSQRLESSTKTVHAQSPRLFGVPVPQRAFGLGAGWRRDPIVGEVVGAEDSVPQTGFECSIVDPVTVMVHNPWPSASKLSSLAERQIEAKVGQMASYRRRDLADHSAPNQRKTKQTKTQQSKTKENQTIESEVAAA